VGGYWYEIFFAMQRTKFIGTGLNKKIEIALLFSNKREMKNATTTGANR
jgi:hypothetical protein